jgi:hypothetical protein
MGRVGDIEAGWLRAGLDEAFAQVAGRFRTAGSPGPGCLAGMLSGAERDQLVAGWTCGRGRARADAAAVRQSAPGFGSGPR